MINDQTPKTSGTNDVTNEKNVDTNKEIEESNIIKLFRELENALYDFHSEVGDKYDPFGSAINYLREVFELKIAEKKSSTNKKENFKCQVLNTLLAFKILLGNVDDNDTGADDELVEILVEFYSVIFSDKESLSEDKKKIIELIKDVVKN